MGLVGVVGSRYEGALQFAFLAGAVSASAVWFTSLTYGAACFYLLTTSRAWRALDSGIAAILLLLALARGGPSPALKGGAKGVLFPRPGNAYTRG